MLTEILSKYMGPARQRQLLFGELVVRNRDWNVDFGEGVILFGDEKYPAQLLGTESYSSNTWLWGYMNESGVPADVLKDSEYAHNLCKGAASELALAEPTLSDLVNGHNIASITAIAKEERVCYYRCPYDGGAAFVLVGNIPENVFAPVDAATVIRMISELMMQLPLNHKSLAKSLLLINCVSMNETESMFNGLYKDGTELIICFDELGP